jgi:hypothetical protein
MSERDRPVGGERGPHSIEVDERRAHRVVSAWTSEETAHRLLETLAQSGIDRDKLAIEDGRIPVEEYGEVDVDG